MTIVAYAQNKLDAIGSEAVFGMLSDGWKLSDVAQYASVSVGTVINWLSKDAALSARVRELREALTCHWDDEVMRLLEEAPATPEEMTRAREKAQHLRWRMSRLNRAVYGDKIDLNHSGTVTLEALVSQSIVKTIEHEPD